MFISKKMRFVALGMALSSACPPGGGELVVINTTDTTHVDEHNMNTLKQDANNVISQPSSGSESDFEEDEEYKAAIRADTERLKAESAKLDARCKALIAIINDNNQQANKEFLNEHFGQIDTNA